MSAPRWPAICDAVRDDISVVRQAIPGATLKVIVESADAAGTSGTSTLVDVCRVAEDAGADFVKTSTGFHPSGGASIRAVELMAGAVGGRLGVKASGGIRTGADALAMIAAGATRLGLSATRAVLEALAYRSAKQGFSSPWGILALRVENCPVTALIRHLNGIRLDAERKLAGKLVGRRVQRGLHRLAGQNEAQTRQADHLQPDLVVDHLRLGDDVAERAVQCDRLVGCVGTDAGDEAADYRDRVLDGLFDAVGGPGDGRVERADRALGVGVAVQVDVVDRDLSLHAFGALNLVAAGGDSDVVVVAVDVLPQERRHRAERHGRAVLGYALGGRGDLAVRPVTCVQLGAEHAGGDDCHHDDDDEHDRQRIAQGPTAFLGGLLLRLRRGRGDVRWSGRPPRPAGDVLGGRVHRAARPCDVLGGPLPRRNRPRVGAEEDPGCRADPRPSGRRAVGQGDSSPA